MNSLIQHLSKIKVPKSGDKVYKDECVFSFDTPETETGLYISLNTFIGLGRDYLEPYFQKTGNAVYLHNKKLKISSKTQGDGPEKKITRLAIGVDGGFNPDVKKFEYEDIYDIVILPEFHSIPWPDSSLPDIVKTSVQGIIDSTSATKLAELEALSGTWDGEERAVSKFASNLNQLDNGKKIPPSGWKCEKCDKVDNLWLNLTDGSVLCGRSFFDGSGGNNHAIDHYNSTHYPLAVKLGTITKDGKADVFSYKEDDMVEDPYLIQHLAHWGINIINMEKTEKSMVELELELNQKNEWATLTESNGPLKPIFGPAYTGMNNMGNSCYLNSVIQMLFTIPSFIKKYYENARSIFFNHSKNDPAEDFNIQMAKLGVGLLSGKYSVPPASDSTTDQIDSLGVCPLMFKTLVGKGHAEFSTKRQQDVQEFFLHLLSLLERNNKNQDNPGDVFKFLIEERFQCGVSKKVKYLTRSDVILPLTIPMDAVINKEEVASYEAQKAEAKTQGKHLDPSNTVRPEINFSACLELFTQSEVINNFYSSAVNENVTARKTTKLASFPDYLLIQLKKFMFREDWMPIKLDVSIDMPGILDISSLRGNGLQTDEDILPELKVQPPAPVYDQALISELTDMGFPVEACKRAIYFNQNASLEQVMQWIMEHINDDNFTDPFLPPGTERGGNFVPNSEALNSIMEMGFSKTQATKALKETDNNMERAMDWIFSHPDVTDDNDVIGTSSTPNHIEIKDGSGKYKLVAFISHMGTSTMVGHYVVHIYKEGRWILYNDNKVTLSEHPPKNLGYLYLYERL